MRAIALRLEGPLQSWGGPVAGDHRSTLAFPTKSGVLGLVSGALGIDRDDVAQLEELHRALALVVRVDRVGTLLVDFHTVMEVPDAGGKPRRDPVITRRDYHADASFAALLVESAPSRWTLGDLIHALRFPCYLPFLGRRACAPSAPVLALREVLVGSSVDDLLRQVPLPASEEAVHHARRESYAVRGQYVLVEASLLPGRRDDLRVRDEAFGDAARIFALRGVARERFAPDLHLPRSAQGGEDATEDTVSEW